MLLALLINEWQLNDAWENTCIPPRCSQTHMVKWKWRTNISLAVRCPAALWMTDVWPTGSFQFICCSQYWWSSRTESACGSCLIITPFHSSRGQCQICWLFVWVKLYSQCRMTHIEKALWLCFKFVSVWRLHVVHNNYWMPTVLNIKRFSIKHLNTVPRNNLLCKNVPFVPVWLVENQYCHS